MLYYRLHIRGELEQRHRKEALKERTCFIHFFVTTIKIHQKIFSNSLFSFYLSAQVMLLSHVQLLNVTRSVQQANFQNRSSSHHEADGYKETENNIYHISRDPHKDLMKKMTKEAKNNENR